MTLFSPHRIFLTDALGAVLSGGLLLFVIPSFPAFFGLPAPAGRLLGIAAFLLSAYSFTCYLLRPRRPAYFLLLLAVANLVYCITTGFMVCHFRETIRWPGFLYFAGEIVIILFLVVLETTVALRSVRSA